MITDDDVKKDIDLIMWSAQLKEVFRYNKQRFWEQETMDHAYASKIERINANGTPIPRAESVAEHSWHMADMALIIGPRFKSLNLEKCLKLAILHDKLEIITGDKDPLGKKGDGTDTHAFNEEKKLQKDQIEIEALQEYLSKLSDVVSEDQKNLILDIIHLESQESKFIKSLDRIQPITFIIRKKDGHMEDDHISFSIKYTSTCSNHFPEIQPYYDCLMDMLLQSIAARRGISMEELKRIVSVD